MTIYVDVLFAVNMFVNYFLLLIAGGFAKTVCNRLRLLTASIMGGMYCVLMYTVDVDILQNLLLKILSTIIVSLIAFRYISFAHFFRCSIIVLAVGFLFGGVVYGIFFLFKPSIMNIKNSTLYIHVSPLLLIICSAFSYLLIQLFNYLLKPHMISENKSYVVTIFYRERSISATGFVDTGNLLSDIFTDYPVILCSFSTIESLLLPEEKEIFQNPFLTSYKELPNSFRLLPVSTVSGSSLLPAFKPDRILLKDRTKEHLVERALVAVFNQKNYNSPHRIILNPEITPAKSQGGQSNVW